MCCCFFFLFRILLRFPLYYWTLAVWLWYILHDCVCVCLSFVACQISWISGTMVDIKFRKTLTHFSEYFFCPHLSPTFQITRMSGTSYILTGHWRSFVCFQSVFSLCFTCLFKFTDHFFNVKSALNSSSEFFISGIFYLSKSLRFISILSASFLVSVFPFKSFHIFIYMAIF